MKHKRQNGFRNSVFCIPKKEKKKVFNFSDNNMAGYSFQKQFNKKQLAYKFNIIALLKVSTEVNVQ